MNPVVPIAGLEDLIQRCLNTLQQDLATLSAAVARNAVSAAVRDQLAAATAKASALKASSAASIAAAARAGDPAALEDWTQSAVAAVNAVAALADNLGLSEIAVMNWDRAERLPALVKEVQHAGSGWLLMGALAAFGLAWWLFRPGGPAAPKAKPFRELSPSPPRRHTIITTHDEEDAEYEPA